MLGPGRYLLGVLEILLLVGFAGLGAVAIRRRLTPELSGSASLVAILVLAVALLIWCAELLGSFGAFEAVPYLALTGAVGVALWILLPRVARPEGESAALPGRPPGPPPSAPGPAGHNARLVRLLALAVAAVAIVHFAAGVRLRLASGMTGFDSTWYHGPFAAGFFQSGNTWNLHYIAPQFLAWFYPANSEVLHAIGMLAFGRDLISPLLNLGWLCGCLLACWCIGRPYGVASWSLALGAVALSLPVLSDQAGEARNDMLGIFLLLAAVAVSLNAWDLGQGKTGRMSGGALALVGLGAGLAAGTKLNFVLPCAALVLGLSLIAPRGRRLRTLALTAAAAILGGGYWYLRNLAHSGNPLPWFDHLGPISVAAPRQELGGRETHSVFGYLANGRVWSDWFFPGLHQGLWVAWPLLLGLAALALAGCLARRAEPPQRVAAATALLAGLAWLLAPTSASGPEGMPSGFESGLRYLAPALVLALALLPTVPELRSRLASRPTVSRGLGRRRALAPAACWPRRGWVWLAAALVLAIALGYPLQRHYLRNRYADPSFTTPGLDSAFRWARSVTGARIATTSTRQYPLFGTDLSNDVQFVGERRPHGGFIAPQSCRAWRRLLDQGEYDYVVASRDRIEPGKPAFPPSARWTEGPQATVILRRPPTVVFRLHGTLPLSGCPSAGAG